MLALAVLVRIAVAIAYRPALFYAGDSSQYLKLAFTGDPAALGFERPSGYPVLIHLSSMAGRNLAWLTALQHLAGLATGVITFALLRRLEVSRWLATLAAAIVLLDAYAIALEQHIVAEAFFTLALVASLFLVLAQRRPSTVALGAAGFLFGASATMRTAGLFAVPILLVYAAWAHRGVRPLAATAVGLALPLLAYASWSAHETGSFRLSGADGWFLYARVAEIGDCSGVDVPAAGRALCKRTPQDSREGAAWHLWNPEGSAHRAFGRLTGDPERKRRLNRIMRDHALAIIRARPLTYAGMVGADFLRYFSPGVGSRYISDSALALPTQETLQGLDPRVKRQFFPDVEPQVHRPAAVVRAYHGVVHAPRWLLAGLAVVAICGLLLPAITWGRSRLPHRREVFLLTGAAVLILLGATATSEFILRYLIPVAPLLLAGGCVASSDLVRLWGVRRAEAGGRSYPLSDSTGAVRERSVTY